MVFLRLIKGGEGIASQVPVQNLRFNLEFSLTVSKLDCLASKLDCLVKQGCLEETWILLWLASFGKKVKEPNYLGHENFPGFWS